MGVQVPTMQRGGKAKGREERGEKSRKRIETNGSKGKEALPEGLMLEPRGEEAKLDVTDGSL